MSTNLVLCVTDENCTVRLTKYRCMPVMFLSLLGKLLTEIPSLILTDIEELLVNNGFEVEQTYDQEFSAPMMHPSLMVSWVWLIDLRTKELKYWDVAAELDGLEKKISGDPENPLDYLQQMSLEEREETSATLSEGIELIQQSGLMIAN